jgi:hypothetical protein
VVHGGGGEVILEFLDDLLHHHASVVKAPDVFGLQLLVGDHDLVAAFHQVKHFQLGGMLLGWSWRSTTMNLLALSQLRG